MASKAQAELETLWNEVLPVLAQAWDAYEQLFGIPASIWPDQERALFNLKPRLYQEFRNGYRPLRGFTPAMERGAALTTLAEHLFAYTKQFGYPALFHDLEEHLHIEIRAAI